MRNSGFAVDGIIKLLLAVAGFIFLGGLEDFFLAPRWLVITALVLLFLSAATQISYSVRKGEKRYLKYPMVFDALLIVAVVVGLILAAAQQPERLDPLRTDRRGLSGHRRDLHDRRERPFLQQRRVTELLITAHSRFRSSARTYLSSSEVAYLLSRLIGTKGDAVSS